MTTETTEQLTTLADDITDNSPNIYADYSDLLDAMDNNVSALDLSSGDQAFVDGVLTAQQPGADFYDADGSTLLNHAAADAYFATTVGALKQYEGAVNVITEQIATSTTGSMTLEDGIVSWAETNLSTIAHVEPSAVPFVGLAMEAVGAGLTIADGIVQTYAAEDHLTEGDKQTLAIGTGFLVAGLMAPVLAEALTLGVVGEGIASVLGTIATAAVDANWSAITGLYDDGKANSFSANVVAAQIGNVVADGVTDILNSTGSAAQLNISNLASLYPTIGDAAGSLANDLAIPPAAIASPIAAALSQFGTAEMQSSPLVIDLSSGHTGITLTTFDAATTATFFDIDGTGFASQTAWTSGSATGFLVDDLNSDGKIDSVSEMFGSSTVDGFAKLAALDSNHDLKIDSNDTAWSSLQVWIDANGNGVTDAGELHSLSSLGISSIDLAGVAASTSTLDGNTISHTSTVTFTDGSTAAIDDVWFTHSTTNTYYNGDYTLDPDILFLPDLRGYGTLPDLDIAMSQDSTLKGMVSDFVSEFSTEGFASSTLDSDAANIMYQWAGLEGVDPTSRGLYVNAQQLEFLENLFGQQFSIGSGAGTNPEGAEGQIVEQTWQHVFNDFKADLLIQSGASSLFDGPVSYNPWTGTLSGSVHLSETATADLATHAPGTEIAAEAFWVSVGQFVDGTEGISNLTTDEQSWLNSAVTSTTTINWSDVVAVVEASSPGQTINGTSGDDTLTGGIYNDTIYGNGGNDTISGGLGGNTLNGGYSGNTTYIFGGGNDYIFDAAGTDQIIMPSGVTSADLTFTKVATAGGSTFNDLLINVSTGGSIQIEDHFLSSGYQIETLVFSDSSTLDLTALTGYATVLSSGDDYYSPGLNIDQNVSGLGGNDNITTGSGNDVLDGGNGNDTLNGGTGNDTYIASPGFDTIFDAGGTDTINVPVGFSASDIAFTRAGSDLIIDIHGLGEIRITEQFYSSTYAVENLHFLGDSSTIDLTSATIQTVGTPGNDSLSGITTNVGGNWFDGRGGDDYISNGIGNNTYVFGVGFGTNTVNQTYHSGTNVIDFTGVDPANIRMWTDSSGSLHLQDMTDTSHSITLTAATTGTTGTMYETAIGQYLEHINFDDSAHTTWDLTGGLNLANSSTGGGLYGSAYADTLTGGSGVDDIHGNGGNDTIIGSAGADNLYGGTGDDTYVFSSGFGSSIIHENLSEGSDTVHFVGVDPSDIRMWTDSSGYLYLQDTADTSHYITINAGITGATGTTDETTVGQYVEQVTFDDTAHTVWDLTGGLSLTNSDSGGNLYGTAYNDTLNGGATGINNLYGNDGNDTLSGGTNADNLYGGNGDDILYGAGGNDYLTGGAGADTFLFKAATAFTGSATITDFSTAQNDKIDISDVLHGHYDPLTQAISDFVQLTTSGSNTLLRVDLDGTGATYSPTTIATIQGVTGLDLNTLITDHHLVVTS